MEPGTQDNSSTTSAAAMERIHTRADLHIADNGRMTFRLATVWSNGQIALCLRVSSQRVRSTVGAGSHGRMAAHMKASLLATTFTERALMHGRTGDGILGNGAATRWGPPEQWAGQMVERTKANFKMAASTATAHIAGRMEGRTLGSGSTVVNMESVQRARTKVKSAAVCGRKENLSSGWMEDPTCNQEPEMPVAPVVTWSRIAAIMEAVLMVAPKARRQQTRPARASLKESTLLFIGDQCARKETHLCAKKPSPFDAWMMICVLICALKCSDCTDKSMT
mmetsp:Transcript_65924/g.121584  ORF Transcript_65924/g.121584 Transcript_65924/m.121584 type:complete len:280 (-) Transcript_65924:50-889(-)